MITCNEKYIEDWLWENPGKVKLWGHKIEKWVARQFKVPSGIIDLLGYMGCAGKNPIFVIVEVKNVSVDSSALAQVSRYEGDIRQSIGSLPSNIEEWCEPNIMKIIIAPGDVDNSVLFEANAMNVTILAIDISLDVSVKGPKVWKDEFRKELEKKYEEIRNNTFREYYTKDIFEEFISTIPDEEDDNNG